MPKKKLRIGWFSFACCEDSTIMFTEMLNERYFKWKDILEFAYFRILKKDNDLKNLDVAFVEGAIASKNDEKKLKKIRKNCKYLVAIGSCACEGMPAGQRNEFDHQKQKEIHSFIVRFQHRKKVVPLHELVKVDDKVPGCPMVERIFLETLDKYLKKFGVK